MFTGDPIRNAHANVDLFGVVMLKKPVAVKDRSFRRAVLKLEEIHAQVTCAACLYDLFASDVLDGEELRAVGIMAASGAWSFGLRRRCGLRGSVLRVCEQWKAEERGQNPKNRVTHRTLQ